MDDNEHVHDWELRVLPRRHFKCSRAYCNEILPLLKAEAMLNDYEQLKRSSKRIMRLLNYMIKRHNELRRATEMLSAGDARELAHDLKRHDYASIAKTWRYKGSEALHDAAIAYADALEAV